MQRLSDVSLKSNAAAPHNKCKLRRRMSIKRFLVGLRNQENQAKNTTSNARPSVVTRNDRAYFGVQKVYHGDYDRSVFICTGLVMQSRGTTNSLDRLIPIMNV